MIPFEDKVKTLAVLEKALMTEAVREELLRALETVLAGKEYLIAFDGGDPLPILFLGDSNYGLAFRIEPVVVDADSVI